MASSPPLVSILVPCYQDESWLDDTLASIAAQTYPHFEVIVSDDASSDRSPEIAMAWSRRDSRFRLVRNERNLGMNPNWNRALEEARGELVAKLDADDQMTPTFLDCQVEELRADPDTVATFCRSFDHDEEMREVGPNQGDLAFEASGRDPKQRAKARGLDWLSLCLEDRQIWGSSAQLHRTDHLRSLGGWNEGWLSSDLDLILRTLETDRPVVHRPEIGIRYRRRDGSHRRTVIQRGWAAVEGILIPLTCLERCRHRLRSLPRRLRHNWWRLWRESRNLLGLRGDWNGVASEHRDTYDEALAAIRRPPASVMLEGEMRLLAWSLRQRWRERASES